LKVQKQIRVFSVLLDIGSRKREELRVSPAQLATIAMLSGLVHQPANVIKVSSVLHQALVRLQLFLHKVVSALMVIIAHKVL